MSYRSLTAVLGSGLLMGLGIGMVVFTQVLHGCPMDNPLTFDRWPSAAKSTILNADKLAESHHIVIIAHHAMQPLQTEIGGTVWTTVEEIRTPNGQQMFFPFSVMLDNDGNFIDVN